MKNTQVRGYLRNIMCDLDSARDCLFFRKYVKMHSDIHTGIRTLINVLIKEFDERIQEAYEAEKDDE